MLLADYMIENFPNLELRPPLFYSWEIGIRFKLGVDYDSDYDAWENSPYLKGVYKRAVTLFNSLHTKDDEILLVVDVDDFANGKTYKRKLNIFSKYVKSKSVLYKLRQATIPYVFPENDDDRIIKTHRFELKCRSSDLKYRSMLKAICNQDMGIRSSIFHRIYFVNLNKNTIFYIYDDRGCDVLATSQHTIKDLYCEYNDWILDYDRSQIEKLFY